MKTLRCRIPSSLDLLNELHKDFPFVPNEHQIRPSEQDLQKKLETMESISEGWESTQDYILSTVFYKPTSVDPVTGKLVADITNIEGEVRFERNEFPYQLDEGGHHYVLWLGPTAAGGLPTEDEINTHITIALRAYTRENRPRSTADDRRNNDSFDFAWYENPNMTVPLVYHVQVFWQYLAK